MRKGGENVRGKGKEDFWRDLKGGIKLWKGLGLLGKDCDKMHEEEMIFVALQDNINDFDDRICGWFFKSSNPGVNCACDCQV